MNQDILFIPAQGMTSGEKRNPVYLTHLTCEIIAIRIVTMHHIRKIGFLVNKSYGFVYKLIQMIPERFLWPVRMTSAGHPHNTGFFTDYLNLFFISCRHALVNNATSKKIHFPDLRMKRKILQ